MNVAKITINVIMLSFTQYKKHANCNTSNLKCEGGRSKSAMYMNSIEVVVSLK